jgi:predicted LPLAT superfamily acyltransferase
MFALDKKKTNKILMVMKPLKKRNLMQLKLRNQMVIKLKDKKIKKMEVLILVQQK